MGKLDGKITIVTGATSGIGRRTVEIFVQEGGDILDASDTMMARLREQPHEREIVSGLQRELHTLKGGARMAGLAPIGVDPRRRL